MLYDQSKFEKAYKNPKLYFIYKEINKIQKVKILELGVKEGVSTSMFLKLCEENDGKLISIDIENYSDLYQNNRWNFIKTRDDNFEKINNEILNMGGLDVVYIDSFHEPNHVKKLFYNYYKLLNKNGFIFIDDISWLPYAKSSFKENNWIHEMNFKTFEKLLEIKLNNQNNFTLEFSFEGSGTAKITKITDDEIGQPKKVKKPKPFVSFFKNIFK